jgi:uncharacterized protein YkwD
VPEPDARLYAAATELAAVVPEAAPLAYQVVEFAMQRHGVIEPSPHLLIIWGPEDQPIGTTAELSERLRGILGEAEFSRMGVGVAPRGDGKAATVLAFQSSHIDTEPIPRAVPAGARVRIEGSVKAPFVQPEVYVTREDGAVAEAPVQRLGATGFRAEIDCGDRRGRQQIEIGASDASGSNVLANFPIWCGSTPPPSITATVGGDSEEGSRSEVESRLVELVNRDRERAGLARLKIDPRLTAIARAHSQEMLDTGVVSHISPTTGSAADRAHAAGLRSAVVLENVARAYGVEEAHEGFMNSPGHRANILHDQVTHVGIGVVFGEEVAGRREMFVTQMFLRVQPRVDVDVARRTLATRIHQARGLASDPTLGAVAQAFAQEVAGGAADDAAAARATARLRRQHARFDSVTTVASTVADIDAFDAADALADTGGAAFTHFGVGVAQGDHPVIGEGAVYIVVLLAR